jgi:hypothetical protein
MFEKHEGTKARRHEGTKKPPLTPPKEGNYSRPFGEGWGGAKQITKSTNNQISNIKKKCIFAN